MYRGSRRVDSARLQDAVQIIREELPFFTVFEEMNIPRRKVIPCPFHNENIPSCNVNYSDNIFYCFSCKRKGNIISFLNFYANEVDNKKETYIQTIERILRSNPDIMNRCGFTSIYEDRTEIFQKMKRGEFAKVKFHKPEQVTIDTFTKRAEAIDDISDLLAFYSRMEKGVDIVTLQKEERKLSEISKYSEETVLEDSSLSLFDLENSDYDEEEG